MRTTLTQDEINHRMDMWQVIRWRMNSHKIEPKELAKRTNYSQDLIERGISGEPVPITFPFLCACVEAFSLSGRGKFYEDTIESRSISEVENILKPQPAMPPRQGNFWEYDDEE
jgi:hypothetical protein